MRALNFSSSSYLFILLYTLFPYLVQQAGRGGWQDLIVVYNVVKRRIRSAQITHWVRKLGVGNNIEVDPDVER